MQRTIASPVKYPIQNFTPTDYRAGIQNIDFAQNRNRTLFVANNLGVLDYNQDEWNVRTFNRGKKERSLAFDERNNRLYVGSQGVFGYVKDNWEYVSLLELIPIDARDFDEVWDVFLFKSKVYFCTFKTIYVYDGQQIEAIQRAGGFQRSFMTDGKLFTQSPRGELLEIKDGALTSSYPQQQQNQVISGVIRDKEGLLLFYNSGQVEFSTPFGVKQAHNELMEALQGTYVNHVLQLSDARLAISTQTAGLFLYDLQKRTVENINTQTGLLSNACLRAFQDYAGNLWVGMQNGLALIDLNSPIRLINQEINLQGSGYDVFEVASGTYYTTSNGIYYLAKNATKSTFLEGTEGPAYSMQQITGKLYAAHHTGLFLLENGKARRIATTNGLWEIKQLRTHPNYVIGGTYAGLYLFQLDAQLSLQPLQLIRGFLESSRFFEEDHLGRIWVGQFYKGLYRLELNADLTQATVHRMMDDFEEMTEEQIIPAKIDNDLYFAAKSGLYRLDQGTDRIIKASLFTADIGDQQVYMLMQDKQKNVHFIADNSVGFFKQISANNYVYRPSSLFQLRYHFNNDLLHVAIHTSDGVMFNANEGFLHYRPELEDQVAPASPLAVNSIYSIAEDSFLYTQPPFAPLSEQVDPVIVSPRARVLQIKVASYQFNEMDNHQFRYFLKGFDEDYGEWTNSNTKEYSNLPEGDYQFFVQTRNYLSKVIHSPPIQLRVTPPWYRSMMAQICYVLLAVSLLGYAFRWQRKRYRQRQQKVEAATQRELAAKQARLKEIEQQKTEALEQLQEDKMKQELQHLNNLLAASTMNLVVKNEFIENIKEELNELRQVGEPVQTKKTLEKIVREIDITLRLQEDWEQFEHHFDQVHGDFLSRLRTQFRDLTPNEQKLCAFLRLNLNTKDIANLMGISLRGVEVARYRLRKKLDLQKGQNLSKFILEY